MRLSPLPVACALLCLIPLPLAAHDVAGTWETTHGTMLLSQKEGNVSGTYAQDSGRITGQMKGRVLEGTWSQENSSHPCSEIRDGRRFWGRFRFVFETGTFAGTWSYCLDEPATESWTGQRKEAEAPRVDVSGSWNTTESRLVIDQEASSISGTYEKEGGRLTGVLQGRVVEGFWTQKSSAQACELTREGESHWGRFRFSFEKNSFSGYFGYCDGPLKLPWNGER